MLGFVPTIGQVLDDSFIADSRSSLFPVLCTGAESFSGTQYQTVPYRLTFTRLLCLNGKGQSENQHCNNTTTSKREISLARRPNQYHITENRKEAETSKRQKYPL
ncbi:hypothetical protein ILYODFUR_005694 [Ilyodon furcidens]|uniref:Uncharacterized protein n=1 Tax=Ilyodon furcidens TaxID=33524 RepID=A0ABV0SUH6_9TELE